MTTIIDPSGTPVPIFNRSGTTVLSVIASGTTLMTAAPLPHYSGEMVVEIQSTDTPTFQVGVVLPEDAEVGDVVEAYSIGYIATVFAPAGETIGSNPSRQVTDEGTRFRKTGPTNWRTF